ncbi:hypothetical protein AGMMS50276_11560 [Synergistales bacterium]|nr:hypothetical protein AGMMS50276_11560 [Synergistales bacterium]
MVGDIYNLNVDKRFDVALLTGVLHHLSDPERAIKAIASLRVDKIIICEPNGWNPVLKLIERFSSYHVAHEEQSFTLETVKSWCKVAGLSIEATKYLNLVPLFCPDWMAKICKFFEPLVEALPLIRTVCCGQFIVVARKAIVEER